MGLNEMNDSDVSIVNMDTSVIPLDVLFHLTVQSSTIRFEGQQRVSYYLRNIFFHYSTFIKRLSKQLIF